MVKIQNTDCVAGEDVEQQQLSVIAGGNKNGTPSLEDSLAVSYTTKQTRTVQPIQQSHLLGSYPKELKTYIHAKIYTWKQARCPSVSE